MKKKQAIYDLVEEAFNSVNNIERASPKPFLLSRVNSRLHKKKSSSWWENAALLIGRPGIVIPGLAMLMVINLTAVIFYASEPAVAISEQSFQASSDEFTYTAATIYDNENLEP